MSGKTVVEDRFMSLKPVFVPFITPCVVVVIFPEAIVVVIPEAIVVVVPDIIGVVLPGTIVLVLTDMVVVIFPDDSTRVAISPQVSPRELSIVNELLSSLKVMVNVMKLIDALNELPAG